MREDSEDLLVLQEASHDIDVDLEVEGFDILACRVAQLVKQNWHQVVLDRLS